MFLKIFLHFLWKNRLKFHPLEEYAPRNHFSTDSCHILDPNSKVLQIFGHWLYVCGCPASLNPFLLWMKVSHRYPTPQELGDPPAAQASDLGSTFNSRGFIQSKGRGEEAGARWILTGEGCSRGM